MKLSRILLAGLVSCAASNANATVVNWSASLDGAQANAGAGTGSIGVGTGSGTFDDVTNLLTWTIDWSGLSGTIAAAHIHTGAAGVNGGVAIGLGTDFTNPIVGNATLDAATANLFFADSLYINIHTTTFGGGEIRGQIQTASAVPLPAGLFLLTSALAGLMVTKRRTFDKA